jgi:hypothetical protein
MNSDTLANLEATSYGILRALEFLVKELERQHYLEFENDVVHRAMIESKAALVHINTCRAILYPEQKGVRR